MSEEKLIDLLKDQRRLDDITQMAKVIEITEQIARDAHCGYPSPRMMATDLYEKGYRKQRVGKWVDQYNGKYDNSIYVCSLCRKGTLLTPEIDILGNMGMIQALSPFCPNCGAKMRKEYAEGKENE